jgi:hypothetical protein
MPVWSPNLSIHTMLCFLCSDFHLGLGALGSSSPSLGRSCAWVPPASPSVFILSNWESCQVSCMEHLVLSVLLISQITICVKGRMQLLLRSDLSWGPCPWEMCFSFHKTMKCMWVCQSSSFLILFVSCFENKASAQFIFLEI